MYFIMLALNLIFYISCGFAIYDHKYKDAMTLGGIGVLCTFVSIVYYARKKKNKEDNCFDDILCFDCFYCGDIPSATATGADTGSSGLDCLDCDGGALDCSPDCSC